MNRVGLLEGFLFGKVGDNAQYLVLMKLGGCRVVLCGGSHLA